MNTPIPHLGIGILSWRGYDSLRTTLTSYRDHNFFDLFAEKLLFLPQIEPAGAAIADEFNLSHVGTSDNLGIMGGFENMARAMTSDIVMLAENDFPLVVDGASAAEALTRAVEHLQSGASHVWRFRHLDHPGQKFYIGKVMKYWPHENAPESEQFWARLRRLFRPAKAHRLKGMTVYIYNDADTRFPDVIKRTNDGDYLVRSDVINWTNNVFLINRSFFLDTIIPAATRQISGRLVNGFPTIETELNRGSWWRAQKFWIGVSNPGLFTHERLDDRGY